MGGAIAQDDKLAHASPCQSHVLESRPHGATRATATWYASRRSTHILGWIRRIWAAHVTAQCNAEESRWLLDFRGVYRAHILVLAKVFNFRLSVSVSAE